MIKDNVFSNVDNLIDSNVIENQKYNLASTVSKNNNNEIIEDHDRENSKFKGENFGNFGNDRIK